MDGFSTAGNPTREAASISARPGFRPDIAALRALAVTAVVLFHFGVPGVPGGFVGVDVFFVISGFLMTSILTAAAARGRLDIVGFYMGRIKRIVPVLIVVTLCTLAAGWAFLLPNAYTQLAWDALWADTFTINIAFARTIDYFAQSADQSWFLHSWSLAVEIQFYVVIPFIVLGSLRIAQRRGVQCALLAVLAVSLIGSYVQTRMDPSSAFYLPSTRAWEFASGGLVSTLRTPPSRRGALRAATGLAMILAAVAFYHSSMAYPGLWPVLPVFGTALVIWAGAQNRIVSATPVRYLGDISYSIYLWHWPVLQIGRILLPNGGYLPFTIETAATLALSALTYSYVETPLRSRSRSTSLRPLATVALGLCAVVLASGSIIKLGGLPSRVSPDILRVVDMLPPEREWRSGKCFLRADQSFSAFAPECLASDGGGRPGIVLWGDSTVADLYPGIKAQPWFKDYAVSQITAGSCGFFGAPVPANLPHCADIQARTLDFVLRTKPDYVVISGSGNGDQSLSDQKIRNYAKILIDPMVGLIKRLNEGGIRHIVVVGPGPRWPDGMPATFARMSFGAKALASKLTLNAMDSLQRWDAEMHSRVSGAGADYISLAKSLCDATQCMALIPAVAPPSLVQFDTVHFSVKGSNYVANHLIGPVIDQHVNTKDEDPTMSFDPVVPSGAHRATSSTQIINPLPQHYPVTFGKSFKIDFLANFQETQVPYATILQNYDSFSRGFSVEFVGSNVAKLFVQMDDDTTLAGAFHVTPNTLHHFELISHDGHPSMIVDGVVVVQDEKRAMTQSMADVWVGGSGLFPSRNLAAVLSGLQISGDVQRR